ncbi:MAG: TIGR03086 family protein [Nocardioides sp.]|nr:TIGR03086 family protein [Nocardioides sp.]
MSVRSRALATGLALWVAALAVTAGGGLLTRTYLPGVDGTTRALLVVEALFALALLAAPFVGTWRQLGVNRPAEWRHRGLLVVPLVVAASPLALGVRSVGTDLLLVLVVGYVLTGITEELVWRGFALRLLAPLGERRAVVLGAALFGTAHLANVFFRDSTGLVLAQAWGAFCFGLAYGALRVRTGTIVPLMALHALTDLAASVGALPKIPVLVAEDVVLLTYGVVLLALRPRKDTPVTDPMLDHLDRALRSTDRIVASIGPDQWDLPSPCAGWTVRDEANHLVGGLRIFTAQLDGTAVSDDHDGHDWLGADPRASYGDAARVDAAAWRRPDALAGSFTLVLGEVPAAMALLVHLTEVLVHGLDLAVAVGREDLVDQDESAWLLGAMRELGTDPFRVPGIFGPEVDADPGAPAHRQLLAHLGREVAAVPVGARAR